ncbi:hypothetical protein TPHA_0B02680 [Tetrapisispora phaffii CBS 4417]|uniref:Hpc2-related domain-containing protein n=1 Tax=Tetrapisispora phaffii (strain ATCC 24235 / CBS 4417 / NBRC 1672 / NRRL Y-8282 / UCD 70-5) TaxID=1071381 RepID=G8BPL0_TETPH|nr:hypothetical protein TPHA_0B02680 [Tetrapisispora phaffii CBS 4417]CCE61941.1 hypothetical protein TPHA_0B02680 [Tetrapisispora phaffii CBS 4417]
MQRELMLLDDREVDCLDKKRESSQVDDDSESKKQKTLNIAEELAKNRNNNTSNSSLVLKSNSSQSPTPNAEPQNQAQSIEPQVSHVSQVKISSLLSDEGPSATTAMDTKELLQTPTVSTPSIKKPITKTPATAPVKIVPSPASKAKKSNSIDSILTKTKIKSKSVTNTPIAKKQVLTTTTVSKSKGNTPKPKSKSASKSNSSKNINLKTLSSTTPANDAATPSATALKKEKSIITDKNIPKLQPSADKNENTIDKKLPKVLLPASQIEKPSLLGVFENNTNNTNNKQKDEDAEPVVILNIPLYPAKNEDYLDENGQVVFNFAQIERSRFSKDLPPKTKDLDELKAAKRNLFSDLNETTGKYDGIDGQEEDLENDDYDDDDDDENEDEIEEGKLTTSPSKKKSHPNKGKNLIGKYDVEDPFIDDSELAWEEQRAATKDGFFVYFGPLIEKGYYASLERINGKMKRGGIKN